MVEPFASRYSEEQLLAAVDFAVARVQSWVSNGSCIVLWEGAVRHGVHHKTDAGQFVDFYRQVTGARPCGCGFADIDTDDWRAMEDRQQRDIRIDRLKKFRSAVVNMYKAAAASGDGKGEQK